MSLVRTIRQDEHGAAILETSLVLIFFITLLGAIIDLGVALYQYNMLRHTTNLAARDITVRLASTNFSSGGGCGLFNGVVGDYLRDTATKTMSTGGQNTAQVVWDSCMRAGGGPLRSFRVRGEMPINCFFICRFLGSSLRLHADSVVTVDSPLVPSCNLRSDC